MSTAVDERSVVTLLIKDVAKKKWCFEFYNFGLGFLKENDIYPFVLIWMCLAIIQDFTAHRAITKKKMVNV
jgi:hypothetical protein